MAIDWSANTPQLVFFSHCLGAGMESGIKLGLLKAEDRAKELVIFVRKHL